MKENNALLSLIDLLADGYSHSSKKIKMCIGTKNHRIINHYINMLLDLEINVFNVGQNNYKLLEPIQLLNKEFIRKESQSGLIKVLPIVDSTNQYLLNHLNILNPGDVCIAEYQRFGRGRYGRTWFSPFGLNLYLSMYWYFDYVLTDTIGLSVAISTAIAELLNGLGSRHVQVKWPNDLYFFNHKLAGILIEMRNKMNNSTQVVIGVGINLAMQQSSINKNMCQRWINLRETGIVVDRNILVVKLIKTLRSSLKNFKQQGLSLLYP